MTDSDEEYQQKFLRSMFAGEVGNDDDDFDDSENGISEHAWISSAPQTDDDGESITVIYHLAFLAPGHGDSIWNSSECIAQHLLSPRLRTKLLRSGDDDNDNWPPKRCIEFGAGAALPSLVLLKEGAKRVIFTDRYVNTQTFDALRMSVEKNASAWSMTDKDVKERVAIVPHTWGEELDKLLSTHIDKEGEDGHDDLGVKADLLIASDCIYNPTYHRALLQSAVFAMAEETGMFIVGYSFHGNVPPSQTLRFFTMAREEFGLEVVSEFVQEYEGQRGIGSVDKTRGAVYVKVLASKESSHCTQR
mmetsp:Transcript_26151/g.55170  ORF Transcript_26151/g.55170 Transcript_26151/m.55170 type:complete len:304 (-) Transcript_26151:66-977(-)